MLSQSEADHAWEEASDHSISETSWGFYSYGDAPPAIGGGVGSFVWFVNRDSMLDFIQSVLPVSPPGPTGNDHDMIAEEVGRIVAEVRDLEVLPDKTREHLNQTLRRYSQIEWWGTFQTLLYGNEPFVSKVRKHFREDTEQIEDHAERGASINNGEIDEFRQYLKTYGL